MNDLESSESTAPEPRVAWRHAVARDVLDYFGKPRDATMRAVVVTLDDRPMAIISLVDGGGCWTLQSESKPDLAPYLHRMPVLRAIQCVMAWIRHSGRLVLAVREEGTDILIRLGFQHAMADVYFWPSPHTEIPDLFRRIEAMQNQRLRECAN